MFLKLSEDVKIKFYEDKISLVKGTLNFLLVEIMLADHRQDWDLLSNYFQRLLIGEKVEIKTTKEDVLQIFKTLIEYQIVYEHRDFQKPDCLVVGDHTKDLIKNSGSQNIKNISQLNYDDPNLLTKFHEYKNILVFAVNDSLVRLREINEKLVKQGKDYIFVILDGDFLSILFHTKAYNSACFECYYERIAARMLTENYKQFIKLNYDDKQNWEPAKCSQTKFNFAISTVETIIHDTLFSSGYFLGNKLINFYYPTFASRIDTLLKMPFCRVCGSANKMLVKENNVNLDELIKRVA